MAKDNRIDVWEKPLEGRLLNDPQQALFLCIKIVKKLTKTY
jgi:hypothetical protein